MKKMNLIYFSASGTTQKVITEFANNFPCEKEEYDLLQHPQTQDIVLETPSVFAMPVYAGRVPTVCTDMLRKFKGANTPAVAIVVYGNRDYDDALLELTDILKSNGFVLIAAAVFVAQHSIFPAVASGRPDSKDNEAIMAFSQKCKLALDGFSGNETVIVNGNLPYREPSEIPLKPVGSSKCNACGRCVKICPTKAIPSNTPRKTDKAKCISCTACIAACPQRARKFGGLLYSIASRGFVKKQSLRKEPEYFYSNN